MKLCCKAIVVLLIIQFRGDLRTFFVPNEIECQACDQVFFFVLLDADGQVLIMLV
jgi:hypothetical protein